MSPSIRCCASALMLVAGQTQLMMVSSVIVSYYFTSYAHPVSLSQSLLVTSQAVSLQEAVSHQGSIDAAEG